MGVPVAPVLERCSSCPTSTRRRVAAAHPAPDSPCQTGTVSTYYSDADSVCSESDLCPPQPATDSVSTYCSDDGYCSELDLDDGIAQADGTRLRLGVVQQIFRWFGSFQRKTRKKKLGRQVAKSSAKCRAQRIFAHMDAKAAEIRRRVELTEAKLEAMYGDSLIESPSTHPKVKKLNRTLTKQKRAAASLNAKRYEMRRSAD